jgi:hypothetical protein
MHHTYTHYVGFHVGQFSCGSKMFVTSAVGAVSNSLAQQLFVFINVCYFHPCPQSLTKTLSGFDSQLHVDLYCHLAETGTSFFKKKNPKFYYYCSVVAGINFDFRFASGDCRPHHEDQDGLPVGIRVHTEP